MPTPTCSIDRCENPVQARGWCSKHYTRWYTHGNPTTGPNDQLHHPRTGTVRIPLDYVTPEKRAQAWASQVRFDLALERLR